MVKTCGSACHAFLPARRVGDQPGAGTHVVHLADLLGHGSRNAAGPADLTVADMAQDLLAQVPGPVDVLAGHSLGSVAALTLVGLKQDFCDRVVIADPPGLAGSLELGDAAVGWRNPYGSLRRIRRGPSWRCWSRTRCGRVGTRST